MRGSEVKTYFDQISEMLDRNETQDQLVLRSNDPQLVKKALVRTLPEEATSFEKVLYDFEQEILPYLNFNTSPNFGAYITGSGNPIGAFAEFIKAWYNQNGLKWNNSPITAELEQLIVRWISEYCLLPEHAHGVLTTGGSMSNLMAIHFALARRFPDREMKGLIGAPQFTIYCSTQTHSSVDRAMVFLGLGRNQLRKIEVNEQFEINAEVLKQTIKEDLTNGLTPLMIIGNAGTTNTGSIDDLKRLAEIARDHRLWFHVDGAYGLPARRLSELVTEFEGIEKADSVIINPHKWMYIPFEASCVLMKEIPEAIHFSPDYLFTENPGSRWESSNHTIELSKEFRALKIWLTLKYYGAKKLTAFVRHDIEMIQYLAKGLAELPHLNIEPHHPLSILCFRYYDSKLSDDENEQINIRALRLIETEGKIFITGTRLYGDTYLRVYYGNPERTRNDVDYMCSEIRKVFDELI